MVVGVRPVKLEEKFMPVRFVDATAVPLPLGKPLVVLYSIP